MFDEWLSHDTYGYQKMARHLKDKRGYAWAGEKLVRKLYRGLGIKGMKPVFKTTRGGKTPYGKFPYLLRDKFVRFPNQVMATDITYIRTRWGMMYFTAVEYQATTLSIPTNWMLQKALQILRLGRHQ